MSRYVFAAKNIDENTVRDIENILEYRSTGNQYCYEKSDLLLISSRDRIDQGSVKVAFDGYITNTDQEPEKYFARKYRESGISFLEEVDGTFRAIIYDEEKERFYGFTDRAGKKVLYYSDIDNGFMFSSHLTPLLRHSDIKPEINTAAMADYIRGWSASFSGGERLIKKVKRIYPSHLVSCKDGEIVQEKYWRLDRDKINISDSRAASKMDELLDEAAEKMTSRDEPPHNVFLSGGFDSTFLLSLLRDNTDKKISTFTWGWKDDHFKDAREMADLYGTDHTEIRQEYKMPSDEEIFYYEEPQNAFMRYPFHELYYKHGINSYWTGLNSQTTFPVCLKNIRKLDYLKFLEKPAKIIPEKLIEPFTNYKQKKGLEVLENESKSLSAVIDWGIRIRDSDRMLSQGLKQERSLEDSIDETWQPSYDSYQENYSLLQLRVRDTARYAYYAQDFDHYDVYGYLPLIEFSSSLPISQKKNRRLLQMVAKGRIPDKIITKGASGWEFVSQQFQEMIRRNEADYRNTINDFIDRGYVDESFTREMLVKENYDHGKGVVNQMIAVYLLERWMKIFIDREEPWRPV